MKKLLLMTRLAGLPFAMLTAGIPVFAAAADKAPMTSTAPQPAAKAATGDDAWTALGQSSWIVAGNPKAAHVVYVFTDTECKYCRQLWKSMQPYLAAGKLQSRHVIVNVISEESTGRGAAVLDARHPTSALENNENSKLPRLSPELAIPRSTLKELDDNVQLMHRLGGEGTPAIAYQDDSGKTLVVQGIPPADVLAKIFGPVTAR